MPRALRHPGLMRASFALVAVLLFQAAFVPVASAATKVVYVRDDQSLSRTAPGGDTTTPVTIAGDGGFQEWAMTSPVPAGESLVFAAGNVTVDLVVVGSGANTGNDRPLRVQLRDSAGNILGTTSYTHTSNPQAFETNTVAIGATTLNAGDYLVLRVYNDEAGRPDRTTDISQQVTGLGTSKLTFSSATSVSVDSVGTYSAAYSATTTQPFYNDGDTAYLRAVVSDPFGSADITSADLTLTDAASTVVVSGTSMTEVASDTLTKTFEYAYTLQAGSANGSWMVDVAADEGTEGTDTTSGNFNVGVPPLAVAKSHTGTFPAGGSGSFSVVVHNNGVALTGTTTVTDTLDASLAYVAAGSGGTGWSCASDAPTVPETVTCTNGASLAGGADLATLTLNVSVASNAGATISNHAAVSHPSVNSGTPQDGNTDVVTIDHPDLSDSSKSVVDLNGGDSDPGDTLRYTITLLNSPTTAANNISVTDAIPSNTTFGGAINGASTCAGTDGSTPSQVSVTGITVAANGSCTIVFDVTVAAGAQPGDPIDNSASIDNPNGNDVVATARTVTVSQSQAAGSGNKVLYAYDNQNLTRTPQSADTTTPVDFAGALGFADWAMTPNVPAGKSLVLTAGDITANLVMAASNTGVNNARPVSVELLTSGGTSIAKSITNASVVGATPAVYGITVTVPQTTLPAGDHLVMRVRNELPANAGRHVAVSQQITGTGNSKLTFATSTVVNVDSVAVYSAAYPAVTTQGVYQQGDTVYVRAVVSDPFGSADASGADLTLTDVNGTTRLSSAAMTQVADSGVATRTFEYAYTLAGDAAIGFWTASVTGKEGTEGTVTHTANLAFGVGVSTLSAIKSHSGSFVAGSNASYSIVVHNNSPGDISGTTTVTDTLSADLAYVLASGTGWSCSAAGQDVTCTSSTTIVANSDLPTITLNVAVASGAGTSVDNLASVANTTVNGNAAQVGGIDTASIVHPDLADSTKDVADTNGGDADPGDTLRYTITLVASAAAAANGLSVTDAIPSNTSFGGSINGSSSCVGTDGSSPTQVSVTGISLAASASCTVVFDVIIAGSAVPGDPVDNTATVTNPNGPGATPAARTITVSQSQVAASGNKLLYPYDDQSLTRTPQSANTTTPVDIAGGGTLYADWQLTPAVAAGKSLVLNAGDITATLVIAPSNGGPATARAVTVELLNGATTIATSPAVNVSGTTVTDTSVYTFTITVPQTTLAAGDVLVMRVHNNNGGAARHIAIYQKTSGDGRSTLTLNTSTVINVDSAAVYSAVYPAVTTQTYYTHGQSAYIRAVVSDPFGSFDVHDATLTLTDPGGTVRLTAAPMTQLADSGVATRTFGYGYVVPSGSKLGTWTATITAYEGSERTVTHTGNTSFELRGRISLGKSWVNATAGNAVDLTIGGGSDAITGSSTAPSTTTAATAAGTASAAITLTEAFTAGSASAYSPALACTRNADSVALAVTGTGLSRGIVMPIDSSVTCTWTNTLTIPLTVVKLTMPYSDPVNGTTNPKAIPGAYVDYTVNLSNPATIAIDADTVFIRDPLPTDTALYVGDIAGGGSGPVQFTDGAPASGLTYTFASLASAVDDVAFSNDSGATWTYTPVADGNGVDAAVTDIRINPKGGFNPNNAAFQLRFRARIK